MDTTYLITARVEYSHQGRWIFWAFAEGRNAEEAKEAGLQKARQLWKQNVAGVKVTLLREEVILERMR